MDRLFLDANVLFSAAYKPDSRLIQLWKLKKAVLCSSRYALEEARINLAEEGQRTRLEALSGAIQFFEPPPKGIPLPEKDVPILLAAISGRATHLLTGDVRHFGAYFGRKIEGISITLPGEYLRRRGTLA